jgi:hypothetical protein
LKFKILGPLPSGERFRQGAGLKRKARRSARKRNGLENGKWKMEDGKSDRRSRLASSAAGRFDTLRFHFRPAEGSERAETAFSIFHFPFSIVQWASSQP